MNIYEMKSAAYLIDGYYLPLPNQTMQQAFDAAKKELIENLNKQLINVESMDVNQWYEMSRK